MTGRSEPDRREKVTTLLEVDVWPAVPADELGRRLTVEQEAEVLGLGPRVTVDSFEFPRGAAAESAGHCRTSVRFVATLWYAERSSPM
jgi:hypothetical protein